MRRLHLLVLVAAVAAASLACAGGGGAASAASSPATPYRKLFFEGRGSFSEGRYADALASFREATRLYPQRSSANHLYARCLLAVGRFREASRYFQKAIEIRSLAAHRPRNLRALFPRAEDFDARISELEVKVRESRGDEDLLFLVAYLYHVSGREAEAAALFDRLAAADFALASLFLEPVSASER